MFFSLGLNSFAQFILNVLASVAILGGLISLSSALFGYEWFCWLFRRKIHEDLYGELYSLPNPHGGRYMLIVKVSDSCGTYYKYVPRHMTRAKQAVAWTYNQDESEFHPTRV